MGKSECHFINSTEKMRFVASAPQRFHLAGTPLSSQPGPSRLLRSVMDFYPARIQVRWFQGQQELSEHVVATDMLPNGDWTYQLLVLLETPARRGLTYTCQRCRRTPPAARC
ncbi:class II histocompatibility antigen, B-L beta chain-like [Haemorhous mexicanus]|uniref:class II histocompatibility antigen, B-L beta chain-like n=1 Tax=Haemorhous mexicanus TaxID=30427 RepID=UPI0028BF30F5|nr:class II histocompatibility antigen, B-L beta chain-like [Haemorhous mexicanus]